MNKTFLLSYGNHASEGRAMAGIVGGMMSQLG
jgi:hypothetical protein